ncbi:hypothetical protein BAE44_0005689 [Dichanthelium oligosanthes]|uniref:Uncharacterized protein n=1 Tax=Dichanthelium oligosanthes TaxID=888268 RepID=A0A1E5W7U4_9POAL|nr:hypothetical protein BAE44_0005689 [Dichanthelium oligosanthes]
MDSRRDQLAAKLLLMGEGEEGDGSAKWRRVVSILGSAGLGKTTLAKELYRANQTHFDCLAWVSTPPHRNVEDILSSILRQVDSSGGGGGGGDGRRHQRTLQDKRYLVVLDGMWNREVCLWHLSIFPEDYPINHDRLIRCWVAEGLVWAKPGKTVEEVGESYLEELMDRHMIQPDRGSYDGKTKAYIISREMLELIRSQSVKEDFVTLLDYGTRVSALPSKIRRLSIINLRGVHDIPESVTMSHIRSLYIFGSVGKKLTFKHLTFLRVLALQGCEDLKNHNVEEIARLRNLRYLSIRDTPISEIPDRIGQLQYLTTLNLRGTGVQELHGSVLQLQRLAHLLCGDKMRFPEWIQKMVTLSY